jgi:penicillin G amidase
MARELRWARGGRWSGCWILSLACLCAMLAMARGADDSADSDERYTIDGLEARVEIVVDRWGVPHIYAQTEADLFFAQGYQAARDRLFQFELWRRQATGTVAEILGRRELERDIGARLLQYRGDMQVELSHYHPRGELIIGSFTRGINAWIEQTEQQPELLPVEFQILGIRPGYWTPEVVVSRHQGLMHNVTQELDLARAVTRLGADRVKDLVWFHPGEPDLELDPAIPAERLFEDILGRYRAARSTIAFRPEDVLPEYRGAESAGVWPAGRRANQLDAIVSGSPRPGLETQLHSLWDPLSIGGGNHDFGSNNWVISGRRTEGGSTIMANDPHRVLQAPSLRYFAHLVGPGWNVIGGGEPTLPGVSIGHNGHGTWGLTIFRIDAEDLYVYETHEDDPLQYRFGDGWESMTVVSESIPVRGEEAVEVELKFTRHGPVLHEDLEHRVAFALRAGWLEPGGAPYLASLRMNQAKTWEEFREACTYSHIPGENMVWADRQAGEDHSGNIGWQVVGIAPIRPNWSGLLPVPGDGRYEWDGYLPGLELPNVFNPPQGFWNTSNENLVPPGYPHRAMVGWTWSDPFRGARVHEVLAAGRKLNQMDMMQLQQDELSIPARVLVPLLRPLEVEEARWERAIRLLRSWDFVLDRDSVPAGIYAMWERRLQENMRQLLVPEEVRPYLESLSMKRVIDWLLAPDGRFGQQPLVARDELLVRSLLEALDELESRFGPDWELWKYGQSGYKHAWIRHPLSPAVNEELRDQLDVGPAPRGGNSLTVNNTGGRDNQPSGGSFRVIIDTGNWDQAVATNSPGQGGDPDGPHYGDLFADWARGGYFPLFYSRAKVESVRHRSLQLIPEGGESDP